MPTWEGIEDASAEASRVWLARLQQQPPTTTSKATTTATTPADPVWKPLRKVDCQRLNEQLRSSNPLAPVHIEGGRATVYPAEGIIKYNFHRGPVREVCAAVWFVKEERSKEIVLHPVLSDTDTVRMEGLYQHAVEATSSLGNGIASVLKDEVLLEDEKNTVRVVQPSPSTIRLKKIAKGWFGTQYDLQRGYGAYTVPGEEEERLLGPVQHVVFVVHGIGEALFSQESVKLPSLISQLNSTRRALHSKQVQAWQKACQEATKAGLAPPAPPGRIELIPIEWFHRMHDSSSSLMKSLQAATLNTIPGLRAIANDVVFDVLMYLTPAFCETVLECVTQQIRDLYRDFLQVHPEFISRGGQSSLAGHSLGSVIVWDLLSIVKQRKQDASPNSSGATSTADDKLPFDLCGVTIASEDSLETVGYQAYVRQELADKTPKGTWGPQLTKYMDLTIPFTPKATLLLGSPLGIFLTLRGAHAVFDQLRGDRMTSPFSLPTDCLYNIFHPSDPVAYRIEPLLMSQDLPKEDLPPPVYLTAPGKDLRLHVKAKQLGDEIRKTMLDPKNSWNALMETMLDTTGVAKTSMTPGGTEEKASRPQPLVFELGGSSPRVDYALQPGVIDNEYLSAVTAHSSYFANGDFQDFFIILLSK